MKRVVVTGMGVVSSVGQDVKSFWKGICDGHSAIDAITGFDAEKLTCHVAAEIKDFRPEDHFDRRTTQRIARFTQFGIVAARQAWKSAQLPEDPRTYNSPERAAVIIGSGIGGLEVYQESEKKIFEKGVNRVPALTIPKMIINEAAGNISMEFGLHGPAHAVATACASGTDAIGHAFDMLRLGRADMAITGGTEACIVEFGVASFCALKALSTNYNDNPSKASRPFDVDRDGFVMGEGAGILILETLEHALNRHAPIYGEIVGWGASADAYHLTAPSPDGSGATLAIQMALADGGLQPSDIDYINAHGTGTPTNDPVETLAIKTALGEEAYRLKVSSIKGQIGHCLGAAGGLEAIASILAIQKGFCPPTIHLDNPDPACDLDYVPNKGVAQENRAALSLSLGFGGHNSVLAFKKYIPEE